MRIPVKILAILIFLTAIFTVIACDKPNLTAGDITSPTTSYTVTFDGAFSNNGSTTTMASPAYKTVTPPATTIDALPTPPTMSGYTFGGWWTATGGTGTQLTTSSTITSDLIVYAYWFKYQVTFQTDNTTVYATRGTIPPSKTVDYFPTSPTKTGYTFAGWYESDGVTQFFVNTPVTADIIVYAKWLPNTDTVYTVTYDGNGGTSIGAQYVTAPASTPPDATVGALPTPPTKLFYIFASWNTKADGSGDTFTASTPVTASITVYAQWIANAGYTVTYNSGWGTSVDAQYVIPPATTVGTLPTPPTKPCYTFGGWWTYKGGTGVQFSASTTVTADITVYAQWTWVGWPGGITPSTYAIGDPGPSCVGKVFYIDGGGSSGTNGLEAAPPGWYDWYSADADPSLYWISGDPDASDNQQTQTTLNGNTSTAIGTGKKNSDAIITQSGTTESSNSAAKLCEDYLGGRLDKWFLPSKDELAQLYANRDVTRWGGFENRYWSSSEYNTWYSWSQYFTDGTQSNTLKSYSLHVRPVRHF
jgi:uncharacterized repeat protein (TIGR02543 family)